MARQTLTLSNSVNSHPPTEAINSEFREQWMKGMQEEMDALHSHQTWELVELPENRQATLGRWVYALKENRDGTARFKARWVAKGYTQLEEIDYQETFAPVVKPTSDRILNALAAEHKYRI